MFTSLFVLIILVLIPLPAFANIILNEVAWMGSANSANDEFIELYNTGASAINLEGWSLIAEDGSPNISLSGTIAATGYFLLERSDDDSVPGIPADGIYTGALGNFGERLILQDANSSIVDNLNAGDGWPAGDNNTKETMQRTKTGSWISAIATPRSMNRDTNSSAPPRSEEQNKNNSSDEGEPSSTYIPPEELPHITAHAGNDKTVIVGESVILNGTAFGFKGELLENPRYLWSFGDANVKEGKNITHAYMYPGTYIVRLAVSSGKYSAVDDMTITVLAGNIILSELYPGVDGWIEITNNSTKDVHLGGWIIETLSTPMKRFVIPSGMIIAGSSRVVFVNETTRLLFSKNGGSVRLYYFNGVFADEFNYSVYIPDGKSISKDNDRIYLTDPTPSMINTVSTAGDTESKNVNIQQKITVGNKTASVHAVITPSDQKEEKNINEFKSLTEHANYTNEQENKSYILPVGGMSLLISIGIGVGLAILGLILRRRFLPDITEMS